VLLVDNDDSYTLNLAALVHEVTGRVPRVVRNDELDVDALLALEPTHVLLSPGPGHPADPADVGVCPELVRRAEVPVLGVCLGHQVIATVLGGRVERVEPAHGLVGRVVHDGSGLFAGLPSPLDAVRYHSLAVTEVPAELRVTARSDDGLVMALQHRERPLHGVQFHPESVLSTYGRELVARFLAVTAVRVATSPPPARSRPAVAPSWLVRELPAWVEPEQAFDALVAGAERAFWLDSSLRTPWSGRFSYLGALADGDPSLTYDVADGACTEHRSGVRVRHDGDVFAVLRRLLGPASAPEPAPGVPPGLLGGFVGGWVGYLGYECKAVTGGERAHASPYPDAVLLRPSTFVALDHDERRAFVVSTAGDREAVHRVEARLAATPPRRRADGADGADGAHGAEAAGAGAALPVAGPSPEEYRRRFDAVQQQLRAGNTYEVNLTHQLRVASTADPAEVYRALRRHNPAPYGAYLRHGGLAVLSSSPERYLRVDADGTASTRPIKGSAPRGATPDDDAAAAERLRHDPKNRAENLMVLDLVRHDLASACEPGSVEVPELMVVEPYAAVLQLVSHACGRLRADVDAVEATRRLFPSGSMTGAPKHRTLRVIDEVEPEARGVYSGALGWFGQDGACDLAVVIRTLVGRDGVWTAGVGGGITVLSRADDELAECGWKADRLVRALAGATAAPGRSRRPAPC
jgi:para-aminobenzoate synthetase